MTAEEKTLLVILTLAAVLVPVAFGTVLGWPVWSWLLLAVPLLSILGVVARNILRRVQQESLWSPHAAPPAHIEQQDQILVPDAALRSALAKKAIIDRAETITAAEHPNNVDVVQHRLASELGAVRPVASGEVEAWADNVQLTLSEADQERLQRQQRRGHRAPHRRVGPALRRGQRRHGGGASASPSPPPHPDPRRASFPSKRFLPR